MSKQYTSNFYRDRQQQTRRSAEIILRILFARIKISSVIDYGCATGIWLAECKRLGSNDVLGIDGDWVERGLLEIDREEFREYDLGAGEYVPERKYDLALCIEVAEHVSEDMADILVRSITGSSDVILFSAAICGQGGQGHINEQLQHYWANKFSRQGYISVDLVRPKIWSDEAVNVIYKQNMLLYVRTLSLKNMALEASIISDQFDLDRIHPDLFILKTLGISISRRSSFINGLKLLAKALGVRR